MVGKNHQFQFGWFGYNQPNWNWSPIFGTEQEQEQELECDFIFFNFLKRIRLFPGLYSSMEPKLEPRFCD